MGVYPVFSFSCLSYQNNYIVISEVIHLFFILVKLRTAGRNRRVNYSVFWRVLVSALCGCFAARVPRVHVGVETPSTGFDWANEWVNNSKEECLTSVVFSAPSVCLTVSKISLVNIWLWAAVRLPFYVLKGSPLRFLLTHHTHTHTPSKTHIYSALSTELSKEWVSFLMCEMLYIHKATQNTRTHISLFIMVMTSHLLFTRYIPMFSPLCHCSLMMWFYFWMKIKTCWTFTQPQSIQDINE